MNEFEKILKNIGETELHVAKNLDRAVASQFGAPVDWTISGESAKQPVLKPLAEVLDTVHFAGDPHHAEDAEVTDAAVQAADNQISAEEKAAKANQ